MDQPWGVSGPEFLALYVVGFLAALAVMLGVHAVLARVGTRARADERLDVYQAAYVAGGRRRLVDTAIAALALRDKVLVSRGGRLTPVEGTPPNGPVEAAVGRLLTYPMSRRAMHRKMRNDPAVLAVHHQVRSRGLVLDGTQALVWRLMVVLPVAVFVVGVARAVNGMNMDRPTDNLQMMLFFSVVVLYWVLATRLTVSRVPSAAGRAALRVLRKEHRPSSRNARRASVEHQLAGVAVVGYAAIFDPSLRTALSSSSASASGGGSSGSGCGSGGGGCGGGGGGCGG
jgi:uncharacterized protein (TIGR04222 family)